MLLRRAYYISQRENLKIFRVIQLEIDLAFFLVESGEFVKGFILETNRDIYHGQVIIVAGFSIDLVDVEGKLVTSVKFIVGEYHLLEVFMT